MAAVASAVHVLTACGDGVVRRWSLDDGSLVRGYGAGGDFLQAVAVSADGLLVVAGGQEGVARVYDGANGKLLRTLTTLDRPK